MRRIFEHTADAGIHVESESLSNAFHELSLAFTEVVTGGGLPDKQISFEVDLESTDLDSLLINYISYLIYLFDTENFLASSAKLIIQTKSPNKLSGRLDGDFYDENKHGYGVEIKAVSYHMLEIFEGPPAKIVVILDL